MRTFSAVTVLALMIGCGVQPTSGVGPPADEGTGSLPPPDPTISVAGAAFSPDSRLLLTVYRTDPPILSDRDKGKRLILWDVVSGKQLWTTEGTEDFRPIGFLANGKAVLLLERDVVKGQDSLQLWDVEQGKRLRTFGDVPKGAIYICMLSADGRVAVSRKMGEGLKVWDAASGELLREMGQGLAEEALCTALSRDGKLTMGVGRDPRGYSEKRFANVFDLTTGELLHSFEKPQGWRPVAFSPDGGYALASFAEIITIKNELNNEMDRSKSELVLWEVATGKEVRRLPVVGSRVMFMPDGKRLVAVSEHGLTVWDVADGRDVLSVPCGFTDRGGFSLSPDGKLAFTASGHSVGHVGGIRLRIWDLTSGKLLRTLEDPPLTLDLE